MVEQLTFNVIYVRDTVELLLPFLCTLLKNSPCQYRLVANGCTPIEAQQLQHFCQHHERTSFYSLSEESITSHGDALNHLLQIEDSPYFAFIDSDIFAVGPWIESHLDSLEQHAAIFAGLPIWQEANKTIWRSHHQMMAGRFIQNESELCLGATYYAIYHRTVLETCMQKYSVNFRKQRWDDVPILIHQILERRALCAEIYDTGKLINILLQVDGIPTTYIPTSMLVHLGAASESSRRAQQQQGQAGTDFQRLKYRLKLFRRQMKVKLLAMLGKPPHRTPADQALLCRFAAASIVTHIKSHHTLPVDAPWLTMLPPQIQAEFYIAGAQIQKIYRDFNK